MFVTSFLSMILQEKLQDTSTPPGGAHEMLMAGIQIRTLLGATEHLKLKDRFRTTVVSMRLTLEKEREGRLTDLKVTGQMKLPTRKDPKKNFEHHF